MPLITRCYPCYHTSQNEHWATFKHLSHFPETKLYGNKAVLLALQDLCIIELMDKTKLENDTGPIQLDWEALRHRGLATKIAELPPLAEDQARGVHIAAPHNVEGILDKGIDYSGQGMLMSTARVWSNPSQIQYKSDDYRFGPGTIDVIFDLPFPDLRLHNDVMRAPGLVPPDHIVGVIDPYTDLNVESNIQQ